MTYMLNNLKLNPFGWKLNGKKSNYMVFNFSKNYQFNTRLEVKGKQDLQS